MAKRSQSKGKRGEAEVVKLFVECMTPVEDKLNIPDDLRISTRLQRNLAQYSGDASGDVDVPIFCVEVKFADTFKLPAWWKQCEEQALSVGKKPMLIYRGARKQWRVMVVTRLFDHIKSTDGRTESYPSLDVVSDISRLQFFEYYAKVYETFLRSVKHD